GLAVNALQVPELERPFADVQRHLIAVLDVGRGELVAVERRLHFRRRGSELLDPIWSLTFSVAHRLAGSGRGGDGGGRRESEMAGGMIAMRLRVDEEAHRHWSELLDGLHYRA